MKFVKSRELIKRAAAIQKTHKDCMRELDKCEDDLCDSRSSNVNDSIRLVQKDIEESKREQLSLYKEATKVVKLINKLDPKHSKILKLLYVEGLRLKDVQLDTGYSQSSISRFRDEALRLFCIKYNEANDILLGYDLSDEV